MSEKLLTDHTQASSTDPAENPDRRHIIQIDDGELHRWVDETWDALEAENKIDPRKPVVLIHGNDLVRVDGSALVPFSANSLKERISRAVGFIEATRQGVRMKTPPGEVSGALLDRALSEYGPGASVVDVVTDVPLLMRDGTVLSEPGYHAEHRVYYQPAEGLGKLKIHGPDEVQPNDLEAAVNFLLYDWFGEFGFADEASRVNALAAMLTVFVRDYISGGVPLVPIKAVEPGWGKSTLTDACFMPGCGVVPKAAGITSEEEMEKRITSKLRLAPTVVAIDNVQEGEFKSAALANVLTSGLWEGRILGESRIFQAEPRCVWTINGNKFTMSGELIERCPAPIILGPGAYWEALCGQKGWDVSKKPRDQDKKKYSHSDFRKWSSANRGRAVEEAFVLIRHWLDGPAEVMPDGYRFYRPMLEDDEDIKQVEPARPDRDSGEFPEWQRVVGGILKAAGIGGLGENYATWSKVTDSETEEIVDFLAAWRNLDLESPITLKELLAYCAFGGPLYDVTPTAITSGRADALEARAKAWVREKKDERFRGYRIAVDETSRGRANRYSVRGDGD